MKLHIKYESDIDSMIKRFDLNDKDIAPLGTFTDDFEWRFNLKEGDLVNAMDKEKCWYKSTILRTRQTANPEGEIIHEVFIGYRTFDEQGNKIDEETKKRYFGWSEKYDIWMAVTDPLIQRYGSIALQY